MIAVVVVPLSDAEGQIESVVAAAAVVVAAAFGFVVGLKN